MTNDQRLQVLREIDKLDKIGAAGVRAMLTSGLTDASGAHNPGVGLPPFIADFVISCVTAPSVSALSTLLSRFDMIAFLEGHELKPGFTLFDRLLRLPTNEDETWNNGGRPKNLAWAIDDLVKSARALRENT